MTNNIANSVMTFHALNFIKLLENWKSNLPKFGNWKIGSYSNEWTQGWQKKLLNIADFDKQIGFQVENYLDGIPCPMRLSR